MPPLPETILQFGSGRFLRAFADLFVHHANEQGQNIGKIVVVQSTGDGRAGGLNAQGGRYHVVVRGLENGQVVDRVEECASISRALHAGSQWADVLALAASPVLHTILSNTTEAGYTLDAEDAPTDAVPRSFPASCSPSSRPASMLDSRPRRSSPANSSRATRTSSARPSSKLATDWNYPAAFVGWITEECAWLHTLVDRIVTGTPKEHPLLATDPMVIVAEPFAFWALEDHPRSRFQLQHPAITRAKDVEPYFLRKVRILNAAHTALLIRAKPAGSPSSATRSTTPNWGRGCGDFCPRRSSPPSKAGSISRCGSRSRRSSGSRTRSWTTSSRTSPCTTRAR